MAVKVRRVLIYTTLILTFVMGLLWWGMISKSDYYEFEEKVMQKQKLQFKEDGTFRIMIIADIQTSIPVSSYTMELISNSLEQEEPDLVVFLGDNIFDLAPGLLLSKNNVKRVISSFLKPVIERDIPFCIIMGNHDMNGLFSKQEQMEYYMTFPNCYAVPGMIEDRVGNYNLVLRNSTGKKDIFNLWFLDSGNRVAVNKGGGYAYVTDAQIAWYEENANLLRVQNNGDIMPALLFQHIAVPEVYNVVKQVPKSTANAVRGHGRYNKSYYVLDKEYLISGSMGEGPCPPDINNSQFESWLNNGDIMAAFFGHDHKNDFVSTYQGIDLVFTSGAGFYSYGKGDKHGVRIIELDEKDVSNYKTRMVYFSDVSDKNIPWPIKYLGSQICMIIIWFVLIMSIAVLWIIPPIWRVLRKIL